MGNTADAAQAQYELGEDLICQGKDVAAVEALQFAARLAPSRPDVQLSLAQCFSRQQRYEEAAAAFRRLVELDPSDLQAQIGLGSVLHKAGQLPAAIQAYSDILRSNPKCAEALTNLGLACQDLGDFSLAAELHREAIAAAPKMADAHHNLGTLYSKQGKGEEALACYLHALDLRPGDAETLFNIGYLFEQRGDLAAAEEYFHSALARAPESGTLRFYLSVLHLLQGRFSTAWEEYEARWDSRELRQEKRNFPVPLWNGEPLAGETILLHAEQGLGDTIQFVRYAPMVAACGGRVVLEVQPSLGRLISGLDGVAEVISRGDPLPAFDWHCPLMSLPRAFHTELESIPGRTPYLGAKGADRSAWAQKLSGNSMRIGLAWAGNPKHPRESMRSIPLAALAPLSLIEGTSWYSLQKGPSAMQVGSLPPGHRIVDLDAEQRDFADTAAIVANLDLVISIDTSVAHLAGALGAPVWVLLHHFPDWRWLTNRDDSPWYPSARLFRKSAAEDWNAVVDRVRREIELAVKNRE